MAEHMPELVTGLAAEVATVVADTDTAQHVGSGEVAVFATPRLVALMEQAAMLAARPCLPASQQTVGVRVDVRHVAATPVGMPVRARAELVSVDGRRLVFHVQAWDERELIGEGTHERMIVDAARFVTRVQAKV